MTSNKCRVDESKDSLYNLASRLDWMHCDDLWHALFVFNCFTVLAPVYMCTLYITMHNRGITMSCINTRLAEQKRRKCRIPSQITVDTWKEIFSKNTQTSFNISLTKTATTQLLPLTVQSWFVGYMSFEFRIVNL